MSTFSWLGSTAIFGDPSGWEDTQTSAAGVPGAGDTALISGTGTLTGTGTVDQVTILGLPASPTILTLTGAITALTVDVKPATTLQVDGGLLAGTTGFAAEQGSTIIVSGNGALVGPLGDGPPGAFTADGAIDINDGTLSATTLDTTASLTLEQGGIGVGTLQVAAALSDGAASLAVTGGTIQADTSILGNGQGGTNTGTIDGAGAAWRSSRSLALDSATLDIRNGGQVQAGDAGSGLPASLTDGGTGAAVITVEGAGSTLAIDGNAWIGFGSAGGLLHVTSGGSVSVTGSVSVGPQPGGSGTIWLDGAASQLTATSIAIGVAGTGQLSVAGGAIAAATSDVTFGNGSGTILAGGSLQAGGRLIVGGTGTANLTLDSGGIASAGSVIVGGAGAIALDGGSLQAAAIAVAGSLSGFGAISGAISNTGTITGSHGRLVIGGAVTGSGQLLVGGDGAAGTLELTGGAAAGAIVFSAGTLVLDDLADTRASIAQFALGETIELHGIAADAATLAAGTLSITSGGALAGTLQVLGDGYADKQFVVTSHPGAITDITLQQRPLVPGIPAPVAGVSTTTLSAADLSALLQGDQGALRFVAGTEAVVLVDGTLSVGPDTTEAYVARLYEGLLGRAPDPNGLSAWTAALDAGTSKAAMANIFLGSNEFLTAHPGQSDSAFVATLYQGLLGRPADPAGLSSWTGALAGGLARGDLAALFADSPEAKQHWSAVTARGLFAHDPNAEIVREDYQGAFGRDADTGGLAYWTGFLNAGGSASALAQVFTASSEFASLHGQQNDAQYVESLYESNLGRQGDPAGAAYWVNALQSGATRGDLLTAFAQSSEAQAHLQWALA